MGALIAGFLLKGRSSQETPIDEDSPLVRTMTVHSADSTRNYSYPGDVRGRHESQLSFQVGGKITKRHVELGSTVKHGQILMQIDPQDIRQIVNTTQAQVASAQSQLHLAEKNLKRYRQLYEEDVISRAQLDRHQSAYEVAQAAHQQAMAQYAQGANQLGYTSLRANQAGVVSGINAEVGQVVGPGQVVITLVKEGEREVEISVPENRLEDLRKATQIKITFWALPNIVVAGYIREIAPMADPISRTYKIRVSLLQPPPDIKLGMTASVGIADASDQSTVVSIPLSALYQTKETPCVWIVQNGVVKLRAIKVGTFGDGQVQVLSGVQFGETIVTAGVHKLREGQKIKIMSGEKS
ncbi:MAG: efflux RND transporter periplasmic adaptor subunit [Syntrophaceae bacterium]